MKKNFRKITSLVVALAVMVTAVVFDVPGTVVAEAAASGTSEDGLTWTLDDSGTLTISGSGAMKNYAWSGTVSPWRTYLSSVTDIVVESGVTSIGSYAFCNLANAKTISIPDSVTSIGNEAFRNCSTLDNVVIPNGVTVISVNTFQKCTSLKSITIPESVTSLALNAFNDCTSLVEVTIPGNLNSIGPRAFYGCTALKIAVFESVVPPTLGDTVFTDAPLEKISVPCGTVEAYKTAANWSAYADIINFDEHKAIKHITAKDPTCTETGNKEYWTCNCGEHKYSDADGSAAATDVTIPIDANAHDWGDWSVSEQPAISTDGESKRTCQTNNAHTETKPIPKLTDTVWTKTETTKPTVSGTGSYTYTSDYGTVTVTVPKLTDTVWTKTEDKKPTVDTDGSYTYTSDYGTVTVPVPKLTDDTVWTKTETTKPTVSETGSYTYTSTDYGTVTIPVPKLTDDTVWTKTETTKPTVDTDGSYTYTSDYGTVTVPVPKLNDDTVWTKAEDKKPTVSETGSYTYTSTDYGTVTIPVPKLTDDTVWTKTETTKPTVDTDGSYTYTSDYGTVTATVPKLSDTSVWTNTQHVDATEEQAGKDVYTSAYGEVTVTIPTLTHTHTLTHVPEVSATETTEGTKEHWHCEGCGKDFLDAEGTTEATAENLTIPKPNHTHSMTHVPEVSATETTEGTKEHWHCEGCNKDFADESGTTELTNLTIPTLTHTHTLTHVPEVSATETTEGTKEHWHCEGCNKDFADENGTNELSDLKIPTLTHTHTMTHVPEVPATETTEGTKEHWHCEGCNKDFLDAEGTTEATAENLTIPKSNHTHSMTHVPEVSATETTEGAKEHWHCEGCNKDFADENGEKEITADELKIGKIEKVVQSGENAPIAELTTPKEELIDAVLTSEEQAVVNDGKDVKIILTIEDATESVSSEDKTAVESKIESLTDYHLGQYLDVNLLKIIDGETEKIAETSAPITITFEIPAELRVSGRSYSVIRVHDGETTVLPDLDNDENTVTIQTDKFSTYALAYLENAAASDPSGGNSGGNPSTPTIPTPGGNNSGGNSGTRPSGSNPSSGNGTSNGNSTANESGSSDNGNDSTNDRNEDDPSDVEDDPSDVEDDSSDVEDDSSDVEDDSSDVEDDFSDDDDDFSDVDDDSSDDDDDSTGVEEDSPAGEGNSESGNSDQAVNTSSEDTAFSVDGTGYASDESDSNPSTGVAVSFVPLAAAIAVLMAAKRKKK